MFGFEQHQCGGALRLALRLFAQGQHVGLARGPVLFGARLPLLAPGRGESRIEFVKQGAAGRARGLRVPVGQRRQLRLRLGQRSLGRVCDVLRAGCVNGRHGIEFLLRLVACRSRRPVCVFLGIETERAGAHCRQFIAIQSPRCASGGASAASASACQAAFRRASVASSVLPSAAAWRASCCSLVCSRALRGLDGAVVLQRRAAARDFLAQRCQHGIERGVLMLPWVVGTAADGAGFAADQRGAQIGDAGRAGGFGRLQRALRLCQRGVERA
ncbi:hypothetical protein LP419_34130 [Massilia sp. H-1]|nr:hypothetical protein LP419_34130 [Massilia sp. H-1]